MTDVCTGVWILNSFVRSLEQFQGLTCVSPKLPRDSNQSPSMALWYYILAFQADLLSKSHFPLNPRTVLGIIPNKWYLYKSWFGVSFLGNPTQDSVIISIDHIMCIIFQKIMPFLVINVFWKIKFFGHSPTFLSLLSLTGVFQHYFLS